ncbi:putative general transcription factor IIH subunit 5 [Daphnia sinensis]|uniref:General transcription and DNA repair factor IIH subunit TFB5 n=1 Tax=Daphnia sinensis TaxID=1820382 RepID=A0AAD5KGL3_9CRUS|nr:putative general transcription factor IIH subunit 5 [Daphnia sinensis]
MVNVTKGILVECDAAMKQLLLHLDETHALGNKFIVQDLDETHLFIAPEYLEVLQTRIDDLMDRISFPLAERETD